MFIQRNIHEEHSLVTVIGSLSFNFEEKTLSCRIDRMSRSKKATCQNKTLDCLDHETLDY